MEPNEQPFVETKHFLFRVTPFSKYLALALFVLLPFVGFLIGLQFSEIEVMEVEEVTNKSQLIENNSKYVVIVNDDDKISIVRKNEVQNETVLMSSIVPISLNSIQNKINEKYYFNIFYPLNLENSEYGGGHSGIFSLLYEYDPNGGPFIHNRLKRLIHNLDTSPGYDSFEILSPLAVGTHSDINPQGSEVNEIYLVESYHSGCIKACDFASPSHILLNTNINDSFIELPELAKFEWIDSSTYRYKSWPTKGEGQYELRWKYIAEEGSEHACDVPGGCIDSIDWDLIPWIEAKI